MDINSFLTGLLKNKNRNCLTVSQIKQFMSDQERTFLGLDRKKTTQKEIASKLTPYLKSNLQILRKGNTHHIAWGIAPEEMILKTISSRPELSSKQLRNALPYKNELFVKSLNSLLSSGQIYCELSEKTHLPRRFYLNSSNTGDVTMKDLVQDEQDFKIAYDQIGRGKHFVRIHQLRQHLKWDKPRFDHLIERLKADYKIQLQSGNASQLSKSELTDSYKDPKGRLRVTITWIGND